MSEACDFFLPVRVYIEDTDAGGIVFYANYLKFMERARTERIRSLGFPRLETLNPDVLFVVHSLSVRYHGPARLDDLLHVTADMTGLGRTWMDFEQTVLRPEDGAVLTRGQVRVACIDRERQRPVAMPATLRAALQPIIKEPVA
ncbi:YbgC/FadM family acyl-CoA thioesterase [Hahella sp. SMD15-11]|uniref:YbgC/FadM family acyl-CoA thioesterase n=1 Tax=Thermohahella caldifontis TaxID=3142973 RepID=A0AB39UXI7_9GAMM